LQLAIKDLQLFKALVRAEPLAGKWVNHELLEN
jgi:hypothetical protein